MKIKTKMQKNGAICVPKAVRDLLELDKKANCTVVLNVKDTKNGIIVKLEKSTEKEK